MQPIVLTSGLNGEVLRDTVTHYQTQAMSRPSVAGNAPDYMKVVPRPGMPLASA